MSVERTQEAAQAGTIERQNRLRPEKDLVFCELDAQDLKAAAKLATRIFAENQFYRSIMGLDASGIAAYWHEFIPLVLKDQNSRLLGAKVRGQLRGFIVANNTHFPSFHNGLQFLFRLGRRIGLLSLLRYLRFVKWWSGLMRRPPEEQRVEMRGTWILVDKRKRGALLGIQLARWAMEVGYREGKSIFTGFADAGNRGLLAFYRRLGFTMSEPHAFGATRAVTLERRAEPQGERGSC
jgi:GNAT superfamily N-acetyltransferase